MTKDHIVTVVPTDSLIIVDGEALVFPFKVPANLHALQWYKKQGHTEWENGPNRPLTPADYDDQVAPFVKLWQDEKARLEQPRRKLPGWPSTTARRPASSACAPSVTGVLPPRTTC